MLLLALPKFFNFYATLKILQRGHIDPINLIAREKFWTRMLVGSDEKVLVRVYESKGFLKINVLAGSMNSETIKKQISNLLGLDDLLLDVKNKLFKTKRYQFLNDVRAISLPQYSCLFETFVQTILGQQISVNVANRIRLNFIKNFGHYLNFNKKNYYWFPTCNDIKNVEIDKLKSTGMSEVKAKAINNVAKIFYNEEWLRELINPLTKINRLLELLTAIYGVGIWTAGWVILRGLRRFDYPPTTDLIVKRALIWWWRESKFLDVEKLNNRVEKLGKLRGLIVYRIMLSYIKEKEK